ncbi:MAG: hypothetical protein M3065_08455 [Actinomycetota bacterium]|nr:hypothetical protein [Actinomycetota bacterium]
MAPSASSSARSSSGRETRAPRRGSDVLAAKKLVIARTDLSARDALQLAVMQHHSIAEILTFAGRGFDVAPGIRRLPG